MTSTSSTTSPVVRVGIDIAKLTHQILWELPGGKRRGLRVANTCPTERHAPAARLLRSSEAPAPG